jgi:N-acylneuraminate cytidylyltransferase/CMP-N,N'-diacetyllegionaminic acid synthase
MILGIIPARAGSKGIQHKNTYPVYDGTGRVPLIDYTIKTAQLSNLDDYCITTDIPGLPCKSTRSIKNLYLRPYKLCLDDTPMIPVIQYAIEEYEYKNDKKVDAVCILQPTSPLRHYMDVNRAIGAFKESGSDSLYSGYYMGIKYKDKTYDKHQEKPHFQRNGAIFIAFRELINQGKLWSDIAVEFEMPKSRSIDIDDMDDMFIAESLIKNGVVK